MGRRNLERTSAIEWRALAETVAEMRARNWDVISCCPRCGLKMVVDLGLVEREAGSRTSLWNRRPPCRRIGCDGQVQFQARPPGLSWHMTLQAPEPTPAALRAATKRPDTRGPG